MNKKFMSILISSIVITGSLTLSSINVNATAKNGWTKATATTWCYYSNGKLLKNVWEQVINTIPTPKMSEKKVIDIQKHGQD